MLLTFPLSLIKYLGKGEHQNNIFQTLIYPPPPQFSARTKCVILLHNHFKIFILYSFHPCSGSMNHEDVICP